ncbi:MAG TPA: ribbon-helix-helix protein, CopG family [Solirubrobacterales bacterium]
MSENETKVLSLRLSKELAEEIFSLARVEGVTVSEAIRAAIYRYVTARRSEEDFKKRLRKRLEEDREILERLAED